MLQLASAGPMVELLKKAKSFGLSYEERILINNVRSGLGSLQVCKVDWAKKVVFPTDIDTMENSTELPEGFCLVKNFIWVRTSLGENLLFPGSSNFSIMEKRDLVDVCRAMGTTKKKSRIYVLDDEKPRLVYVVDRVTLTDDDAIDLASNFDQRFPIYGLRDGNLNRVIYQSQWLAGEDLRIWKIGINNVIWSNMAKLLFHL